MIIKTFNCKKSLIEYFGIQSLHSLLDYNKSKDGVYFDVYLGSLEIINSFYSIIAKNEDLVCLLFNSGVNDVVQEYTKNSNFKNNSKELKLILRLINLLVLISSQEIEKHLFNRNILDFYKRIISKTIGSINFNLIQSALSKYTTEMTNYSLIFSLKVN